MSKVNAYISDASEKPIKPKKEGLTPQQKKLKNRNFRAGGYSVILTLLALAAVIAVNVFAAMLPSDLTKFDTTSDALFTLSDQSKQIVSSLESDVTVYLVAQTGNENTNIVSLLEKYEAAGSRLDVVYKDPVLYPKFVSEYTDEELEENSIIVVSDKRSRVIPYGDIIVSTVTGIDYTTYAYNYSYSFNGESEITSAIDYVTTDVLPVLYSLTGHGETALPESILKSIAHENINLKDLSIIASGIPDDCSCLLISSPVNDISDYELEEILDYLDLGGRLILLSDFTDKARPNLDALMADYGITVNSGYVVEQSAQNYYSLPYYLLPDIGRHEITAPLIDGKYYVLFPIAQGFESAEAVRSTVNLTPLLLTSDKAYIETDTESQEKNDGEKEGRFMLAVAITETVDNGQTRIVCFSSSFFLEQQIDNLVSGANSDLLLNSVGWICERENSISIRAKSLDITQLVIDQGSVDLIRTVIIFVIPLAVVAIGVIVVVRRRQR
ncbi:MAG: GldG family protein [Clostridia bacterium]|nr:GldG family protein [Clostridia bacterium]